MLVRREADSDARSPRFGRDAEELVAFAWRIEVVDLIHKLLFEFAEARGLGRAGHPGDEGYTAPAVPWASS